MAENVLLEGKPSFPHFVLVSLGAADVFHLFVRRGGIGALRWGRVGNLLVEVCLDSCILG